MLKSQQNVVLTIIIMTCFLSVVSLNCIAEAHAQSLSFLPKESAGINYSLIYIIHGDASYLYHDQNGNGHQADEEQVAKAKTLARKAKHGEVFIFHLKPERKILWIFPRKDRRFYYFRKGKLVEEKKYSPASNTQNFVAEAKLYHKYLKANSGKKILLYFGHEVPLISNETSYFESRPDEGFNTRTFTRGVKSFVPNSSLDLTVLSTCDNGSPPMIEALEPLTKYVLASPQSLHLSHIDTDSLLALERNPDIPTKRLALKLASSTFDRLKSFIQTAVTLSVYNISEVKSYLGLLAQSYRKYLKNTGKDKVNLDNGDCSSLPFWKNSTDSKGVTSYYKPAAFGHKSDSNTYSGWGCQE